MTPDDLSTPEGLSADAEELITLLLAEQQLGAAPELPIPRRALAGPVPLSFAQQRLWFLDQYGMRGATYHMPLNLRLTGPLRVQPLVRSLQELVRRHESLRTAFLERNGEPVQEVTPRELEVPQVDLSGLPAPERDAELSRLAREALEEPFDLSQGLLLRARLIRLREAEHVLLVVFHHIASDGWSVGIYTRELAALYTAFASGRPSPLPPLPIQYADFAEWQRERAGTESFQRGLAYWKQQLQALPPLELPNRRPRPENPTYAGAIRAFKISPEITALLDALNQRTGATQFMTLLAAFGALLHRYTGQAHLPVGSPVANRNRAEMEGLIGFFVNSLVLRVDAGGNPSFLELIERVRRTSLDAFAHQDIPFESIVEALQPERTPSRNPLFQVMLAYQQDEAMAPRVELAGVDAEVFEVSAPTARFDLELHFWREGAALRGYCAYATEVFDDASIERLLEHYTRLLALLASRPEWPISRVPLLTEAEQRKLTEWNQTATDAPRRCIHELFQARAAENPEATALQFQDERLSYRQLEERSSELARHLRRLGVGLETRVAVFLHRSPEAVISFLAILKAGGAFVPLDPSYPERRLAEMIEASGATFLLADPALLDRLPPTSARVIRLAEESSAAEPSDVPGPSPTGDSLAYVMFTSGSTGAPRGVAVTHRNVVRLVARTSFARFAPDEVFLLLAPLSFDASTLEIWGPLLNGATLAIFPPGPFSLSELGECIRRQRITTLWLTSGLFTQMVDEQVESLRGLRQLVAGGDVLSPHHARKLLEQAPGLTLINGYGPTENTTFTACHAMRAPAEVDLPVPIGRPISNTRVYVVDAALNPLPPGIPGELVTGGDGVARGYLGRPELTAEKFIPDPFSVQPGARLYRTGDLARFREDGTLEFLGRIDRQAKIRGFRVEPGEIEAHLLEHPRIREASVVIRESAPGEKVLDAYIAPRDQPWAASEAWAELRAFLEARLPGHLIPSTITSLEALPRTATGKLDWRALPAPHLPRATPIVPRSPIETAVARMFAELLNVAHVGPLDDFFALGGHSLLATRLVSRLRAEYGVVDFPLRSLFAAPTPEGVARHIEALTARARPQALAPIPRADRGKPLPVSYAQQRLWLLERLGLMGSAYNIPLSLRLSGALERGALERALDALIQRHEVLRTLFREEAGVPVQVPLPTAPPVLRAIDLSTLAPEEIEPEVRRLALEENRRLFDLTRDIPLRALLITLGERSHVLLVTLHHITTDGWSEGLFARELSALYLASLRGEPSPLPELPLQYADFATWQRRQLQGEALQALIDYWKKQLQDIPLLQLPTDHPRGAMQTFRGGSAGFLLPEPVSRELSALCQREGVTMFMVFLAAYALLLQRYTGQERIAVGSPVANRTRKELEPLIGFFVNTLVLRADLQGDPSFLELLRQVRETALGAYAHQELPFEKLVEALNPERRVNQNPLFQVMLGLQEREAVRPTFELPDVEVRPLEYGEPTARFDQELYLWPEGGSYAGVCLYNADLFEPSTIERMLAHLQTLLASIAAAPGERLSRLGRLSPSEQALLREASRGARRPLPTRCLHEYFEAQAERTPEATALIHPRASLTYGELNRRANQLARYLHTLGVGPEAPVAVCTERSAEMGVGLLGILKAGAAYVPLDPAYPRARLEAMLASCQPPVILTQAHLEDSLPRSEGTRVLLLDADWEHIARHEATPPSPRARLESLAYVLYTSGSTGTPKGVLVEHRGAATLIDWALSSYPADELRGVLASTSICFDLSVFELFVPLACGGAVILVDNALHLPELPSASAVTLINTVPSAATELVRVGGIPPGVRVVNLAGEPLPNRLAQELYQLGHVERVCNLYGPSEDSTYSTFLQVARGATREPTIGRPLDSKEVFLLDAHLRQVPFGVPGELYLGGPGLARGYLYAPEQTAARFIPHPFSDEPGARLYRTGDLARLLPDGELEFLGRIDHQVKVHGFRIELGEIETVLSRHPGVREIVVISREDRAGQKRLVAYLVPSGDEAPPASELRRHVMETLPGFMVPAAFVSLPALPLTPNGKVDRRALPAPEASSPAAPRVHTPPRTDLERRIASVWQELLGVEQIGLEDNFFELGGHSLLTLQLHRRLLELTGATFPLVELFHYPTVASLAAFLDRTQERSPAMQTVQDRARRQREALLRDRPLIPRGIKK